MGWSTKINESATEDYKLFDRKILRFWLKKKLIKICFILIIDFLRNAFIKYFQFIFYKMQKWNFFIFWFYEKWKNWIINISSFLNNNNCRLDTFNNLY